MDGQITQVDVPMTEEEKLMAHVQEIVRIKAQAEFAYEQLDKAVKEFFAKYGEITRVYAEQALDDDKQYTRVAFIDNVKKLQTEGNVFHATGFKSVAIKVDRLKNLPK